MAIVDLVMPKLGESIMEATVLKWHKQPGDSVQQDETVLEIATDKVDSEVPSITDGIIDSILFKENDVVPIGAVIATIRTGGDDQLPQARNTVKNDKTISETVAESSVPALNAEHVPAEPFEQALPGIDSQVAVQGNSPKEELTGDAETRLIQKSDSTSNRFYSPLVINIANSEGVSMQDLERIAGSGNEGRVTKKDILSFIDNRNGAADSVNAATSNGSAKQVDQTTQPSAKGADIKIPVSTDQSAPASPRPSVSGNVEFIEMDRMGRLISEHMTKSLATSAHVTSFSEADVTNMVLWRNKVKTAFEKREGTRITFTPLFIEVIARCLKKFPLLNSSVDGTNIILRKDINIGMATALGTGNLIVPVIKNADQLNLTGLAKQVNDLADKARINKLKPEDTQGGTFTLTNVGTFGSLAGTPIINQPQVAILAVGTIKKRPVVVETPAGDTIGIRHMMYLSMSYDHRIINGSIGASFLTAVAKELESFDFNREA